jgi:hypothetical protein
MDEIFYWGFCFLKNQRIHQLFIQFIKFHNVTRHNTIIHTILSIAPQLSISQKALETLPEDGNVIPKHVEATIHD